MPRARETVRTRKADSPYNKNDKKNEAGYINFTLLQTIGKPVIDCHIDKEEIFVAFDLYRDLFKL